MRSPVLWQRFALPQLKSFWHDAPCDWERRNEEREGAMRPVIRSIFSLWLGACRLARLMRILNTPQQDHAGVQIKTPQPRV